MSWKYKTNINWLWLFAMVLICQTAGIIGSVFTFSAIPEWYRDLVKPTFSPPNWLFAPVWTILYTLMGISVYLVQSSAKKSRLAKMASVIFWIQLVINSLWSIVFFGMRDIGLALIVIILLLTLVTFLTIKFKDINKTASLLLLPYLIWISFAAILNFSLWTLN